MSAITARTGNVPVSFSSFSIMKKQNDLITVAVVTGGHPYDLPNFHRLFRSFFSLDCYLQHMDDFAADSP